VTALSIMRLIAPPEKSPVPFTGAAATASIAPREVGRIRGREIADGLSRPAGVPQTPLMTVGEQIAEAFAEYTWT